MQMGYERTKQLLEKWLLPVGEERGKKLEFCGDVFKFKASSADELSSNFVYSSIYIFSKIRK